jgi:hypothetical protein
MKRKPEVEEPIEAEPAQSHEPESVSELFQDKGTVDILYEPDPLDVFHCEAGYDYFWAAKDLSHPQNYRAMERYGWRLVSKVGGRERNAYGQQEFNELVLMRRKAKLTEEVNQMRKRKVEAAIRRAERSWEDLKEYGQKMLDDADKNKTIIV